MSATYAKRFSEEERAQYKQDQRERAAEQLAAAVEALQTSDGFQRWLETRSRFRKYSFGNVLLIGYQLPEATHVAAASVWRQMGRYPAKGSHALYVWGYCKDWFVSCQAGEDGARYNAKKGRHERKVAAFKLVPVFDVSQTDGEDLPDPPPVADLTGASHDHLEAPLVKLADELGYQVLTQDTGDAGGWCDHARKEIVIGTDHAPNARVRVLVHEIAHALGIGYKEYGRSTAEVLVESATYIVLAGQGFPTDIASVGYIAGWGKEDTAAEIKRFSERIDEVARKIESAL